MPKFSQSSFSKLATCHIDLQVLFYEVIKSFDCQILAGYRNKDDQDYDFNHGKSKLSWPHSKHNSQPSMAVDVAPYPVDFDARGRLYFFAGYVLGIANQLKDDGKMTHAVRYGGDWNGDKDLKDQTFNDLVHFELID